MANLNLHLIDVIEEIPLEGWTTYTCGHCARFESLPYNQWAGSHVCCGPDKNPVFAVNRLSKACPVALIEDYQRCDNCNRIFHRDNLETSVISTFKETTYTCLCSECKNHALGKDKEDASK